MNCRAAATLKIGGATPVVQASHSWGRRFMTALKSGKIESCDTFKI
jgi:hypothetical protein